MKTLSVLTFFLLLKLAGIGQSTEKEQALELCRTAIKLMDNGQLDESIDLLTKAQKLDPERIDYPYETAYAYYQKKDYAKAIEILHSITNHRDVTFHSFQLLGNSYDLAGEPDKALEIYAQGMNKFPEAGNFYLESGNIEYARENYNEAIAYWEKGIKVDPNYPSNYYWLSKSFSFTNEKIWALFYGEIFINLEPGTSRTKEISKLLYNTYQKSYVGESSTSGEFKLTEKGFVINAENKDDLKKIKKGILPFEGTFASIFVLSAINFLSRIDIATIAEARANFLKYWFDEKKMDKHYENKLLSYQNGLKENGLFEAYSYWLLAEGNPEQFEAWYMKNSEKFAEFADWFRANTISIRSKDLYSRRDY
ncbi:MAG: tetratricopeptide repeat protein [Bacteroidia bacterium]